MEDFFIKSLIAGVGIAIPAAIIGIFILWKKMAYFGDALSHSSILGLGIAAFLSLQPICGIVIFAVIFALLTNFLNQNKIFSKDTIIAIISYSSLAIGLVLISIFPESINLNNYLLGDILAISNQEIILIYIIAATTILAVIFYFKKLLLCTINKDLAAIENIKVEALELQFLLLTSLVIAIAIKIVGIFLITALLIMPASIARIFSKTPARMLISSIIIAVTATVAGLSISFLVDLPTSPMIIAVLAALIVISLFVKTIAKKS